MELKYGKLASKVIPWNPCSAEFYAITQPPVIYYICKSNIRSIILQVVSESFTLRPVVKANAYLA